MEIKFESIIGIAGLVTAVCTAIFHFYKVKKIITSDQDEFRKSILKEAKDAGATYRIEIQNKIHSLENDIENLRDDVSKDLSHLKETYTNEIKNLVTKIEDLRDEIRSSHGSMVSLLTALVEKRQK